MKTDTDSNTVSLYCGIFRLGSAQGIGRVAAITLHVI